MRTVADGPSGFYTMVTGQIESATVSFSLLLLAFSLSLAFPPLKTAQSKNPPLQKHEQQFPELDNLFCRYSFSYGPEWRIMQGIDQGFSQVARKGTSGDASVVWNFPVDITFKSTNPFGWPRLVVSVYSLVRFYSMHILPLRIPSTVFS